MALSRLAQRIGALGRGTRLELRSAKLFLGLGLLWVLPIGIMLVLSLRHVQTIQEVAAEGARSILFSSQTELLKGRLKWEADRLGMVFSRIKDETYSLSSYARTALTPPFPVSYRSGSRYRLVPGQSYCSPTDDGNSALFAYRYHQGQDRVIAASESLDLLLKPLTQRESRVVVGWVIHAAGIARAYPWRDFTEMPVDREQTSWPFYYLAGPKHNPKRRVLFTPVYLDPLSHEWMVSCLAPVYERQRHVATVGLDVTIHDLLKEIGSVRVTRGSSVLLVSGSEILAASDNLPLALFGLDPKAPAHGQQLGRSPLPAARRLWEYLSDEKEKIRLLETPQFRAYLGHAAIPTLGWKLVLLVPESDFMGLARESGRRIMEETRDIILNYAHILIFVVVGVIAVTVLLLLHQSKGLRVVLTGIRRFGEGDLRHRMPEDRTEFGQLAHALNSMAQSLQEKKAELLRVSAEVEQERKLSAVGRLAAGVAHEVNNPLATISTYTQLLLRREDLPDPVPENLKKVMGEIQRIQSQLRNLLDLSRLQSPALTVQSPNAIVAEVADLFQYEASARGVELVLSLAPGCREVALDRSGLKQVVWNLLGNALDAQGSGGRIWLRSYEDEQQGRHFVLEVEDEGPGIAGDLLPQIFEPFYTTKGFGQGTGLGLAVVYSIVKGHGGEIAVRNVSPRGCLFRVSFPGEGES